ncbi:DUF3152 domain-containing protein [Micromonospora sp. WMMD812]|uniref:DUF3152 domain-containing protein n=1 Tax=Micromonospora sp. WMMD812 TaxID=3015152 RepID=UPI00248B7531|nr:DUF3152 domain-containing protein [Micromonospora sp. WMMD812]WBB66315.1 DUF3152 domain-containing protein [Micromonospora sp. WMMD812]
MTTSSPCDPPDPARPPSGSARRRRPARDRMYRRRRRTALLGLVLLLAATGVVLSRIAEPSPAPPPAVQGRVPQAAGAGAHADPRPVPSTGEGRFSVAAGGTPVRGVDGPLRRYQVVVEQGAGQDADAFAASVDATLADPRSWIASGELRVQRVAEAAAADFTIYLATPVTSERMCAEGGLSTEGYTSCRLPGQVIINLARWMEAVPDYGAPLSVYRTYVVNHEVGHEFGEGHEACPGPGRPAPVMQQQTYGLEGCVANAWPYLDGRRYAGEIVP